LLAQPKKARRGFGAPREPLKSLGDSPVTQQAVQLFEGRYGPYVTDGTTNASLPKGMAIEEITLPRAVELLAERAARGPSERPKRRGPAAKRAAGAKQPAAKKAAAPKAASKRAPAKAPAKKKSAKKPS
jgi:DNA topoisomerase I